MTAESNDKPGGLNETEGVDGAEVQSWHTRLLRMSLSLEDNRAYWENVRPGLGKALAETAFEERWFGGKSLARVRLLLNNLRYRYNERPMALAVLRAWRPRDPDIRRSICHWHLQLSDPMYREFTGDFLVERRRRPEPRVDRDAVVRWLAARNPGRWAMSTTIRLAENLLTSAAEAGLCSGRPGVRRLAWPGTSDVSLSYVLYLLRRVAFNGSMTANPYLFSVLPGPGDIDRRTRELPGLAIRRMGDLRDFEWTHPDLRTWAVHTIGLDPEEFA